jgi:hypothetical protein
MLGEIVCEVAQLCVNHVPRLPVTCVPLPTALVGGPQDRQRATAGVGDAGSHDRDNNFPLARIIVTNMLQYLIDQLSPVLISLIQSVKVLPLVIRDTSLLGF